MLKYPISITRGKFYLIIVAAAILLLILLILLLYYPLKKELLILPLIGIISFIAPLLFSCSSKYNLGSRLNNGEVRKSIAISLTVLYIIIVSTYFYNGLFVETAPPGDGKLDTLNEKNITENITKMNAAIRSEAITVSALDITNEVQNNSDENLSDKDATDGNEQPDEEKDTDGNEQEEEEETATLPTPPSQALESITKNFLYVYTLIIGFYFGSRLGEDLYDIKKTGELAENDSISVLKMLYAMGEIDETQFTERRKFLESQITEKELINLYVSNIKETLKELEQKDKTDIEENIKKELFGETGK